MEVEVLKDSLAAREKRSVWQLPSPPRARIHKLLAFQHILQQRLKEKSRGIAVLAKSVRK
jgi:hypothetical protein